MGYLFDQQKATEELRNFFVSEKPRLDSFGLRVNQTFEAFTFAKVLQWYRDHGWTVRLVNPVEHRRPVFRLKFTTRGIPNNFSYAICTKEGESYQVRHQIRIATKACRKKDTPSPNICCDVAIIRDIELDSYSTNTAVPNENLVSFCEVKHMSAYAELLAAFIGMVHELQPDRLRRIRSASWVQGGHISPFLHVSGTLYPTARGIKNTVQRRKYDIDIFCHDFPIN